MKTKTLRRSFAIVTEDPDDYKSKFDTAMEELWDKEPEVITDLSRCFRAVIYYTETETIQDGTVADEFHAEGLRFLCMHCPHYEKPDDRRIKHVACKYADLGRTHLEHEACEVFYKQVKNGTVQPNDEPISTEKKMVIHGTGKRWI